MQTFPKPAKQPYISLKKNFPDWLYAVFERASQAQDSKISHFTTHPMHSHHEHLVYKDQINWFRICQVRKSKILQLHLCHGLLQNAATKSRINWLHFFSINRQFGHSYSFWKIVVLLWKQPEIHSVVPQVQHVHLFCQFHSCTQSRTEHQQSESICFVLLR